MTSATVWLGRGQVAHLERVDRPLVAAGVAARHTAEVVLLAVVRALLGQRLAAGRAVAEGEQRAAQVGRAHRLPGVLDERVVVDHGPEGVRRPPRRAAARSRRRRRGCDARPLRRPVSPAAGGGAPPALLPAGRRGQVVVVLLVLVVLLLLAAAKAVALGVVVGVVGGVHVPPRKSYCGDGRAGSQAAAASSDARGSRGRDHGPDRQKRCQW